MINQAKHPGAVRRGVFLALKVLIVGGLLAWLGSTVAKQWADVRATLVAFDPGCAAGAVACHAVLMVMLALLWRELMGALGHPLGVVASLRMQWLAALAKYVPGKVGTVLGKIYLGGVEGADRKLVGLACTYEVLFCFIGSSLVLLGSVAFGSLRAVQALMVPALALVVVLLASVHPRVLVPAANWVLRRFGKEPIRNGLTHRQTLLFALGYALPYVLGGVSEYLLLRAFFRVPVEFAIDLAGINALATSIGFAALFAPAGLGVRDGLVAQGLCLLRIPAAGAALVALAGRLMATGMDLLSGVVGLALYGRRPWRGAVRSEETGKPARQALH